jgi:hypothetical protein
MCRWKSLKDGGKAIGSTASGMLERVAVAMQVESYQESRVGFEVENCCSGE